MRNRDLRTAARLQWVGGIQADACLGATERQLFEDRMLTAKTYYMPEAWQALFASSGYTGDYYWTVLE